MNDDLKKATFETFEPETESQKQAFRLALEFYRDMLKPGRAPYNVLLTGNVGIGKSHLAASAAKALSEAGADVIFLTTGRLFRKIKSSWRKDSEFSEDQLMGMIESADILFLDDIGAQNGSDWKESTMLDLIDARQGKPTFYTSNLTSQEMAETVGERNMERIINQTRILKVEGRSRRKPVAQRDWGF